MKEEAQLEGLWGLRGVLCAAFLFLFLLYWGKEKAQRGHKDLMQSQPQSEQRAAGRCCRGASGMLAAGKADMVPGEHCQLPAVGGGGEMEMEMWPGSWQAGAEPHHDQDSPARRSPWLCVIVGTLTG